MSWREIDDKTGEVIEKIEVSNDSEDEAPDPDEGWKYAGNNDYGTVYVRKA